MSAQTAIDPLRQMIVSIAREVATQAATEAVRACMSQMNRPEPRVPTPEEHFEELHLLATEPSLSSRYVPQPAFGEEPRAVRRRKLKRKLPRYLTEEQAKQLFAVVAAEIEHYQPRLRTRNRPCKGKLEGALLDELLVHLGVFLGMRISEWRNLDIEHVDLVEKTLLVFEGKNCKDRLLPVPDDTVPVLANYIGGRKSGPMILSRRGTRVYNRTLHWRCIRLGDICGFPRKLNPHSLRHTCASRMLERGVDLRTVQEFLGHASMATTGIYLHVAPGRMREAANLASKPRA